MSSDDRPAVRTSRPRLSGWKEVVAAAGVILSLVFVGLELRQNTRAIRATVRNDLATASRDYLLAVATSPDLSAAYEKWLNDEETTAVEDEMVLMSVSALLRNLENVFLQTRLGTVDYRDSGTYGLKAPIFNSRRFRQAWDSSGYLAQGLNADFAAAFAAANGLQRASR